MNTTKKLTEAALLSSLFIVVTIISVSTGFGYAIYLDFIVPIFFCIICLKCDLKYTILSGITSLLIISLVLGNLGTAIWATQSVLLGIMCGYLINKPTMVMDDLVYGSVFGVIVMVFIDIYASTLIGYSFMKEFQGYSKWIYFNGYTNFIYYLMIALFPFGMVFCIYLLSLILGNKLHILDSNSLKKLLIFKNFRTLNQFLCCSKKVFYICVSYLTIFEVAKLLNVKVDFVYLKTVFISIAYLCVYFIIRDSCMSLQNFIIAKFRKLLYARISFLIIILLLFFMFDVTVISLIIINAFLNKKINIRLSQNNIVNKQINLLIEK
ncbi:membrane protein [Clostridioides difficile]|uniref:DUF2232 domain-containing protein n=1 Tax=Clostridioides difficile TaxID=1496 RepID=UPI000D1E436E|nr:DUF2232 domain-containing protein [Clostridioides difficile]UUC43707.1 YybS family protein [Clostridioides difficile]UWD43064.1 YybS family protein [Clostridioides difficile]UWD46652.1 YybS family protein [Clostridioides difficile]VFF94109.1 membrane protein [Clostridioides difficile]VIF88982.1 membrane protein [Clostridioides difficile]